MNGVTGPAAHEDERKSRVVRLSLRRWPGACRAAPPRARFRAPSRRPVRLRYPPSDRPGVDEKESSGKRKGVYLSIHHLDGERNLCVGVANEILADAVHVLGKIGSLTILACAPLPAPSACPERSLFPANRNSLPCRHRGFRSLPDPSFCPFRSPPRRVPPETSRRVTPLFSDRFQISSRYLQRLRRPCINITGEGIWWEYSMSSTFSGLTHVASG